MSTKCALCKIHQYQYPEIIISLRYLSSLSSISIVFFLKEEEIPYEFSVNDVTVDSLGTLKSTLERVKELNTEKLVEIVYQPQAVFRVRAVTRCTSTIAGHTEAVIAVAFSPDGRCCAVTQVCTHCMLHVVVWYWCMHPWYCM